MMDDTPDITPDDMVDEMAAMPVGQFNPFGPPAKKTRTLKVRLPAHPEGGDPIEVLVETAAEANDISTTVEVEGTPSAAQYESLTTIIAALT